MDRWISKLKAWRDHGPEETLNIFTESELQSLISRMLLHSYELTSKSGISKMPHRNAPLSISRLDAVYLTENLLTNALDAARPDVKLQVNVRLTEDKLGEKDCLKVEFADNGKGMSAEQVEAFNSGRDVASTKGGGKGLPIIAGIVKKAGARSR